MGIREACLHSLLLVSLMFGSVSCTNSVIHSTRLVTEYDTRLFMLSEQCERASGAMRCINSTTLSAHSGSLWVVSNTPSVMVYELLSTTIRPYRFCSAINSTVTDCGVLPATNPTLCFGPLEGTSASFIIISVSTL